MDYVNIKVKSYTHLNRKISNHEIESLCRWMSFPDNICTHAFFPLIYRNKVNKKYKRSDKHLFNFEGKYKNRPICYAAHKDTQIYSYYAQLLSERYEAKLEASETPFSESVTAYRKIKSLDHEGNKCSIDCANDVFNFIKNIKLKNKVVSKRRSYHMV